MDEPLLGRSGSRKYTRKSDHPLFSLISSSPRTRSARSGFDPSSPRAGLSPSYFRAPSSPFLSQPSSPRLPDADEQEAERPESFRGGSWAAPHRVRNVKFSRSSSVRGQRDPPVRTLSFNRPGRLSIPEYNVTEVSSLHQIPEEPRERQASASVQQIAPDLEAQRRSAQEEEEAGDGTGVIGEPLTPDGDGAKSAQRCWASDVKDFFSSAIPTIPGVIEALSVFPELDTSPREASENADSQRKTPKVSGLAELFGASPRCRSAPAVFRESSSDEEGDSPRDDAVPELPFKGEDTPRWLTDPEPAVWKSQAEKKRKHIHKCRTAPLLSGLDALQRKAEPAEPAERASKKQSAAGVVWQAFAGLLVYLLVGVLLFSWKRDEFSGVKTVGVVDALYFCVVTMCTIGYGDITPTTISTKLLTCGLMFVGFGFVDAMLSGMLKFVLDRQEHLVLSVVEDGHHERTKSYVMDCKKGRMRIRMKVALAVGTVLMTILVGVFFLHYVEDMKLVDSLYVTCISITTVGYGDYSFQTLWGRLFAAMWLLLSTLGVARAFFYLAEARVQRRHRRLAKKILRRKMTTADLVAMDLDNDGHISKSEFVVYKLKEMGKINELDIKEICNQFDFLDNRDAGKITLGQLLDNDS